MNNDEKSLITISRVVVGYCYQGKGSILNT